MALLPAGHDIPHLLSFLRPGADWGWDGGPNNDTTSIVWRDGSQVEPTEQEYLDEQITQNAITVTAAATKARQRGRSQDVVGEDPSTLAPPQVVFLVEELLARFRALDKDGLILPIDDWGTGV